MKEALRFEITDDQKRNAVKRRIKKEKRWRPMLVGSRILLMLSLVSLSLVICLSNQFIFLKGILIFIFALLLVISVVMRTFITSFSSRWITDRLNEHIWIQDGNLNQLIFYSVSGGLAYHLAGNRASHKILFLNTVKKALYDPDSGRIEMCGHSKVIYYKDYNNRILEGEHQLSEDYFHVFYDYTVPSLYEYLLAYGIQFEKGPIDYSVFDRRP